MHPLKTVILLIAVATMGGIGTAQDSKPTKTVCSRVRLYMAGSEIDLGDAAYDPRTKFWAELGYRFVRPCSAAQIENEIRVIGPANDPLTTAKLTVIVRASERTEKANVPYSGGWRQEERAAAVGKMGAALSEVMVKIDPTYKARLVEYAGKHPEEDPNRQKH
jgi:hypothetical protein